MEEKFQRLIGQRINTLLSMHDKKQAELAKFLDVTANTVSFYCSGQRTPNTEQIVKISEFFGVTTDYLLGKSDVENAAKDKKREELMYLMNIIEKTKASLTFDYYEEPYYGQFCDIHIADEFLVKFLSNYNKVSEIFNNNAYPDSIKNSVRNTLIDEYLKDDISEDDFEEISMSDEDLPFN